MKISFGTYWTKIRAVFVKSMFKFFVLHMKVGLVMSSGDQKPGGKTPDFFGTRTRPLLPKPINSDVVGKPKSPKTRLFWYPNSTRTREMVLKPDFCYPNSSLSGITFGPIGAKTNFQFELYSKFSPYAKWHYL